MAKPTQSSLSSILLSIILLLSVPVLLVSWVVVYKEAQHSFKETVRENLNQSAKEKAQRFSDAIALLKAKLFVASKVRIFQEGTLQQAQQFILQLAPQLPTYVQCVQLTDTQSGSIIASSCGNRLGAVEQQWLKHPGSWRNRIYIEAVKPSAAAPAVQQQTQLQLLLSTPISNYAGKLRYALSIQLDLEQFQQGNGVIMAADGTILAHQLPQEDAQQLQIITNAIAQQQVIPLSFAKNGKEFQTSYTKIPSPLTNEQQDWTVLSITPINNASCLPEIQLILFMLTAGLLAAIALITRYLVNDFTQPIAKLRKYLVNIQTDHVIEPIPYKFKIRELQQLAEAFNQILQRLKTSLQELETSWQEAQAANQLKSEFLATTSHELRTPLNAIIGCVRLVREGCCDDREEEMDFLARADEAAIHLLGIINDILDTAKIEAGKLSVMLEVIDLKQLLTEVINLQAIQIEQKGLELIVSEGYESIMVQADSAKLKQVLLNVIGNATKFTQQGSITITTRIESGVELNGSKSQVIITVKDTGVGIDPEFQHKLFRPYVMVNATTTRNGGTGLGLAISRNLIELMGGSITLRSAGNNQGTTVAIAMPIIETSPLHIPYISAQPSCTHVM